MPEINHASADQVASPSSRGTTAFEYHFTPLELAEKWNLSHDTIMRMFRDEPGVVVRAPRKRRGSRTRTTLRIPESVAIRVYERMQRKPN